MRQHKYPSDVTDEQWALVEPLIPVYPGGRDNAKNVDGRKRHIVVDSMGLLLAVLVTAADVDDGRAALELFGRLEGQPVGKVRRMFADSKYHNYALYEWVGENAAWDMVI